MNSNHFAPDIVLGKLGIANAFDGQPQLWAEAMAAMPAALPFLNRHTLPQRRAQTGLGVERDAGLLAMIDRISADQHLRAFAWYLHWRVFAAPEHGAPWGAPELQQYLGDLSGVFYQLVALGFVPALQSWHQRLGYPEQVTHDTLQQIAAFDWYHLSGTGLPGFYPRHLTWLNCYLVDPYVRLGRFEYQLQATAGQTEVWRRETDGQILALAPPGAHISATGLIADSAADGTWLSERQESGRDATGFPIHPAGRVLRHRVTLHKDAWTAILKKGDMVLNMHIPAGGGMTWDAMSASFKRAAEFFARHHPDRTIAGAVLTTWFLDPQLNELLPPDANPLRLQRACYLLPTPSAQGGLWFIFQRPMDTTPPAELPRRTSLQRVLADFLASGRKWNGGSMFLPACDMDNLQEGRYTRRFAQLAAEMNIPLA